MKKLNTNLKYILLLFLISCSKQKTEYSHILYDKGVLNISSLATIDKPEKALLTMYLYAYGNSCDEKKTLKCTILETLQITDECNSKNISFLKKWFKKDYIFQLKLNNCPVLANNSAIQNTFDKIHIIRNVDTISISYRIKGLNNSQEKSWNVTQKDSFLIKKEKFIRL